MLKCVAIGWARTPVHSPTDTHIHAANTLLRKQRMTNDTQTHKVIIYKYVWMYVYIIERA